MFLSLFIKFPEWAFFVSAIVKIPTVRLLIIALKLCIRIELVVSFLVIKYKICCSVQCHEVIEKKTFEILRTVQFSVRGEN